MAAAIRAFWALELGASARRRAVAIAAALREQPDCAAVRWVREESLHMTLRFLGAVEPARLEGLVAAVGECVNSAPFAVRLAGVELFPSPRRPRVVALGLAPAEPLAALAAQVERGAVAAGFPAEARAFRAHVTLGRAPGNRRIASAAAVTGSVTADADAWDVTETVLFRSDSAPGGARYTPLARVPLHP
jgi:RNA 2',3'-cyclic 3'-phosphodiesterase